MWQPKSHDVFFINNASEFAKKNQVILLEVRGFYQEAKKQIGKKLNLYSLIAMKVADDKKRTLLLHFKLT